ncbi:MAG: beta-galactosidase trimerization domain-containing protein, partial [Clostridia bacterium]|nr:beta-galactosidase trimerization domain-containing protein [Clostridia bacterium]
FMDTHLELESLPTGGWGYDHFPKSVRYASTLGMEYLGMTGKFHASWGDFGGFKHPNALRYEVALSLANGAKCSIGDQMHPYGFLDDATYELIGVAYAEAEAVEEYCYDIETVADVAILSAEALGILTEHRGNPCDTGANRIMLEGKYLYDIIDTESDFGKYKLIILPDLIKIDERIEGKLKAFVRGGGKLLCSGVSGTGADGGFVFDLGCEFAGASGFMPSYIAPDYEALGLSKTSYVVRSKLYNTRKTDGEILAYSRNSFFNRTREHFCSHRHTPYECVNNAPGITVGKDGAYIAWDIFTEYAKVGSYVVKEAVIKVVDKLLGEKKTLKTNLPSGGVVTLNRQREHDREVLHALYAAPVVRGTDTEIIEDLIPISNTEFEIKTDREVRSVTLVPENTELDFRYECGAVKFTVPTFTCKQVVVIKF